MMDSLHYSSEEVAGDSVRLVLCLFYRVLREVRAGLTVNSPWQHRQTGNILCPILHNYSSIQVMNQHTPTPTDYHFV